MSDLRDLIAETLAGHRIGLKGAGAWLCSCGVWTGVRGRDVPHEFVKADYERHVADVLLAALGDRVLPEGGLVRSEWRVDYEEIGTYSAEEVRRIARKLQPGADRVVEAAGGAPSPVPIERRFVTSWDDGTELHGPWRPVDTEETPA